MVENFAKPTETCSFQRRPKNFGGRSLLLSLVAFLPFLFYGVILSILFGRGFDLSDESFYILQIRWWDSFLGGLSLFGAYLSRPYQLLGEDILYIRLFGALLLWMAGYVFGFSLYKALFRYSEINSNRSYPPVVIAFMTFTFYWTFGIFTPNYNLLVLTALLVTTSLVLIGHGYGWRWFNFLIYGIFWSALVFIKVSSAVAAILLHLAFILLYKKGLRYALILFGISLLCILLNYCYFRVFNVDALEHFRWGWNFYHVLIAGSRLDELVAYLRNNFLHAFVAATQNLLPIIAVLLMLAFARNRMSIAFDRIWVWAFSIAIILVVTFHTQFGGPSQSIKLSVLAMLIYGLFKTTKSKISFPTIFKTLRDKCSLPVMISMMPFAYSAGTSNDLVAVAKAAMVFPLSLIFITMMYLIRNDFKKVNAASVMTMIAFVATPATGLVKPWFNAAYVYRQPVSLSEMSTPIELEGGVIKIDAATAACVQELREMLAAVNIPGEAGMIDFTGRMPGLVLLSGGKPLGLAWILAGYPGSKAAADLVIKDIPKAELERAVFLAAAANEKSDSLDWKALLHGVIDWESTHKFAGAINFPNYLNSAYRAIEVWVPVRIGFSDS